jgi:hypothetical protein
MVFNNGSGNTLPGYYGGATELNRFYGLDPTLKTTDYNQEPGNSSSTCNQQTPGHHGAQAAGWQPRGSSGPCQGSKP